MRILILLVCAVALAATIGTIIVGSESFEGIVVEKPYQEGLAWDKTHHDLERLGWSVAVAGAPFRTGDNELSVGVFGKNRAQLPDAVVSVTISRPSTGAYDRTYQMDRRDDGQYSAAVNLPLYGYWDVIVTVASDESQASFKKSIFAKQTAP